MNWPDIFFLVFAGYRIKYPDYYYSMPIPSPRKLEVLCKMILGLYIYNLEISPYILILLLYSCLLPYYPWYLFLSFSSYRWIRILSSIISAYGLQQPPWNKSILYKIEKYILYIVGTMSALEVFDWKF
jgi:hypothetical protein